MAERKHKDPRERAFHLSEVARLYLQGKRQNEIAMSRQVTQSQISKDLKLLQAMWMESAQRDFDTVKQEQLAKIDHLEREAWAAWERSLQDKEVTFTEQANASPAAALLTGLPEDDKPVLKPGSTRTKTYIRKEGQTGNTAYLAQVQWCIEQRCKIFALYPSKDAGGPDVQVIVKVLQGVSMEAL